MHCNPRNKDGDKGVEQSLPQKDNPEGNRTDEGMLIFDKSEKNDKEELPEELTEEQNIKREGVSEYREMKNKE